jgi:DNA-binding SARP family transcriptional activator/tetratricopeptide (TPR) repeat protein
MRFGLLGPVAVMHDDTVVPIRAAMPRTLFAALLLNANRVVSTGQLVDVLWGEHPPASAIASLQNHVSRLRVSLGKRDGQRIKAIAPGYLVEIFEGELDVDVFSGLSQRGLAARRAGDWESAATDLSAALALWRGDPLADVKSAALHATEGARLTELRLEALEGRIDADLHLGRRDSVIAELSALISAHPLRERLHGLLMLGCYRAGRQADALMAYQHARNLLCTELGVEPGAELQRLHQLILAADPSLDAAQVAQARPGSQAGPGNQARARNQAGADGQAGAGDTAERAQTREPAEAYPVPSQLPADIPDFTGRDEQVMALGEVLTARADPGQPRAVVVAAVTGSAGIGKTTLAVHVAHRIRGRFPHGQLFVSLRGAHGPLDPADVLARFLRDLGIDPRRVPAEHEERAALLRTLLSERNVLIVLDDASDTAQVRPLLPGTAGCAVLVTSRDRLGDLTGRHVDLDVLDDRSSLELFTNILGSSRPATEPEAMTRLVRLCAGLPLAIRIAAGRLTARPSWSIAELADRLADQRLRLGELRIGDLAVRASFQLSYGGLRAGACGVDPARAFRLLALFDGADICLPGAAALLGAPEDQVRTALEMLVDARLLQSAETSRYRLHDLLRVYGVELAYAEEADTSRSSAVRRLMSWYLHTSHAAARVLAPRIQYAPLPAAEPDVRPLEFATYDQAMEWCGRERANLVAATGQAARYGMHGYAWRIPFTLRRFFRLGKYWTDWIATYQIALNSVTLDGDLRALGWILNSFGQPYTDLGQFSTAIGHLERGLAILREAGDRRGEAATLVNLGVTAGMLGEIEGSLTYLRRALAVFRDLGDRHDEAVTLQNIGHAMLELHRYDEAISCFQQAISVHHENGDKFNEANILSSMGQLHYDLGQHENAAWCYQEALRLCRSVRDRGGEATALRGLGNSLLEMGRSDSGLRSLFQARDIFDAIGDPVARELDSQLAFLDGSARR